MKNVRSMNRSTYSLLAPTFLAPWHRRVDACSALYAILILLRNLQSVSSSPSRRIAGQRTMHARAVTYLAPISAGRERFPRLSSFCLYPHTCTQQTLTFRLSTMNNTLYVLTIDTQTIVSVRCLILRAADSDAFVDSSSRRGLCFKWYCSLTNHSPDLEISLLYTGLESFPDVRSFRIVSRNGTLVHTAPLHGFGQGDTLSGM